MNYMLGRDGIRRAYSVDETAAIIGVTGRTVQKYINNGLLKSNKIGGRRFIPKESVEAFLSSLTAA
jgi:excisionase family DNA binding protein